MSSIVPARRNLCSIIDRLPQPSISTDPASAIWQRGSYLVLRYRFPVRIPLNVINWKSVDTKGRIRCRESVVFPAPAFPTMAIRFGLRNS